MLLQYSGLLLFQYPIHNRCGVMSQRLILCRCVYSLHTPHSLTFLHLLQSLNLLSRAFLPIPYNNSKFYSVYSYFKMLDLEGNISSIIILCICMHACMCICICQYKSILFKKKTNANFHDWITRTFCFLKDLNQSSLLN